MSSVWLLKIKKRSKSLIRGLGARILYETLFINDLLALRTSHRTFHSQTGGMIFGMVSADASES